jgi:hypothetical protein
LTPTPSRPHAAPRRRTIHRETGPPCPGKAASAPAAVSGGATLAPLRPLWHKAPHPARPARGRRTLR